MRAIDKFERRWDGKLSRVPLKTTTEMADELGVSPNWLGRYIKADQMAPKPKIDCRSGTVKNWWYDPREVRAWWAARKATE